MRSLVFVGTYTQPIRFGTGQILEGKGDGMYCLELDYSTGKMKKIAEFTGIDNPSYLTLDKNKKFLYAVNELKAFEGKEQGAVSAFALSDDAKTLTFLNQRGTGGTDPCHVVVNRENTHVYVSNFMSGSVCIYPIMPDGSLGEASQFIQHEGSSINPRRQTGPHAHSLIFDAEEKYAFVPDLGIDKMMTYKTDFVNGTLTPGDIPWFETFAGAGPRHCVFSPCGSYCYLINELASSLSALAYDAKTGGFTLLQTVPTVVDESFTTENTCADVHITPNGRFLYGSNRGHNSIVIYEVDPSTGMLSYVDTEPCGGEIPRNFAIEETGQIMLVANQDTDNIVTFAIDQAKGTLTKLSEIAVPTPVCVKPYRM